jgi:hypothetical protein
MTINFTGSELGSLTTGLVNAATREANTTGAQIAPYVAEGTKLYGDDNGHTIKVAASATKNISLYWFSDTASGTRSIVQLLSAGTALFEIFQSGLTLAARYWNGAAWTSLGTTAVSASTLYKLDLKVTMDNSSGAIAFLIDDTSVQTFAGDTILDTPTTINQVIIRNGSTVASESSTFSAVIVADEEVSDVFFNGIGVTGAGTNSQWTGASSTVDEVGVDDTDFMTVAAAAQTSTFAAANSDATFASGYDVVGVGVWCRGSRGPSGQGFLKPSVYSGSTIGAGDSDELAVTWGVQHHFFTQDPDTAAAWTIGGVDGVELGAQSAAS